MHSVSTRKGYCFGRDSTLHCTVLYTVVIEIVPEIMSALSTIRGQTARACKRGSVWWSVFICASCAIVQLCNWTTQVVVREYNITSVNDFPHFHTKSHKLIAKYYTRRQNVPLISASMWLENIEFRATGSCLVLAVLEKVCTRETSLKQEEEKTEKIKADRVPFNFSISSRAIVIGNFKK